MKKRIILFILPVIVSACYGQAGPPKPCASTVLNGGFETPLVNTCWIDFNAATVQGWNTTASDNKIEMWDGACMGVPAYQGNQFAELNANMVSNLYEDICTPCPNVVTWSFAHRGRQGVDVCQLKVGPIGGPYSAVQTASDGNTAWGFYSGTYQVPLGQTVTRFLFESVSAAGGNTMIGNFLDAVNFTFSGFHLTTSQTNVSCGNSGSASVIVNGGSGPYTYYWLPSGGNAATAAGLGAGSYTVIVTDAGGCSSNAVFNITSTSGFSTTASSVPVSCFGLNNGSASITVTGGTAPFTYAWNVNPVQASSSASNLTAGNYVCTVTDANGCTSIQTVAITQPVQLNGIIAPSPASCGLADGSALVSAAGGTPPYSYQWLTNPVQNGPAIFNLAPGSYSVIITDANGCTRTNSGNIAGGMPPLANFIFTPENLTLTNSVVYFTDLSNNAFSWYWDFGDGSTSTQQHPFHQYTDTGTYCITLVVTDAGSQCKDTLTKCLRMDMFSFYIPNSFTPNGDNMNEGFFSKGKGIAEYSIWLFDRWGNRIWDCHYNAKEQGENTDPDGVPAFCKWDGRVEKGGLDMSGNSGRPAQEDVYIWKVWLTDVFGQEHKYLGHVNVIK